MAIAGCGVISAVGRGVPALRTALQANASGLRASERFNHERFQSRIVGAALDTVDAEDPAYQLATAALNEARENGGRALANVPANRLGFVLSTTKANIEALERLSDGRPCSAAARRHLQPDRLTADLATEHGAHGPVQTISVACVSGLVALMQGAKLIQFGMIALPDDPSFGKKSRSVIAQGVMNTILQVFAEIHSLQPRLPGGRRIPGLEQVADRRGRLEGTSHLNHFTGSTAQNPDPGRHTLQVPDSFQDPAELLANLWMRYQVIHHPQSFFDCLEGAQWEG